MTYREKLRNLSERLKAQGELDLIKDVEETIKLCGQYVQKVINMEAAFIASDLYKEIKENRESVAKLDEDRHRTHEALIAHVKLLNKLCDLAATEHIFTGEINSRVEIGHFASEISVELFRTRKL